MFGLKLHAMQDAFVWAPPKLWTLCFLYMHSGCDDCDMK